MTAAGELLLAWDPERDLLTRPDPGADALPLPAAPTPPPLLAADSWLVQDGLTRGLALHRERFAAACLEAGPTPGAVARFWRAAVAELPRTGAWFPRVELGPAQALGLRLRPAPPRGQEVRVLPWTPGDPRSAPQRKGPDLPLLAELKAAAQARGADDALLSTAGGQLIESTTASLLWWEGDVLLRPESPGQLPGVTAELISYQARSLGIAVLRRPVTLAGLAGREVWLVNALHGIRPVTRWVGTRHQAGRPERAPHWRRMLAGLREDLGPHPAGAGFDRARG
ncbi:aminotransferase class IV [Kitasatospora sp. NBC_01287]|uniref:aminotransferase class IV n=1 Tax=Kitasatospora sp. NBC_01287 TaxID=2903573 RepID=UPI0022534F67|nr:aminotransferase class IV [Kitasatospora sp. NBC_01287]MCX4745616.1 aminotransferase class IV [Kitasatospora sp. NBC_01287]